MAPRSLDAVAQRIAGDWKAARRRVLDEGATRDAVHAWRIATRRLLALEALLAPRAAASGAAGLEPVLHRAFRSAGRLRDAQLCRQALQRRAPAQAARREQRALKRLETQARRTARAATGASSPITLHRRRIALKQLRYMGELCRDAGLPLPASARPARLARDQTALGQLTDLDVMLRVVKRHARRQPDWAPTAHALTAQLEQERAAAWRALRRRVARRQRPARGTRRAQGTRG